MLRYHLYINIYVYRKQSLFSNIKTVDTMSIQCTIAFICHFYIDNDMSHELESYTFIVLQICAIVFLHTSINGSK